MRVRVHNSITKFFISISFSTRTMSWNNTSMLALQTSLLRWTGFFPLRNNVLQTYSYLQRISTTLLLAILSVILLCGTTFSCALQTMTLVDTISRSSSSKNTSLPSGSSNNIFHVLSMIPYVTINSRGLLVLLLLLLKRKSISNLLIETEQFFCVCFSSVAYRRTILKSHERWSVMLFAGVIALHCVYDTVDNLVYYSKIDILTDDLDTVTWTALKAWQGLLIWLTFSNIPFILSQQAYLYIVLLAALLNRAIKDMIQEMKVVTEQLVDQSKGEEVVTEKEVKLWRTKHMATLKYCGLINDSFSLILFVIYWLDFLTLLGYTSEFTNISSNAPITTYLRLIFNCVLFASYGALIPIPLVCVYENVSSSIKPTWNSILEYYCLYVFIEWKLGFHRIQNESLRGRSNKYSRSKVNVWGSLFNVTDVYRHLLTNLQEAELVDSLEELERICRCHVCMFNGAKLIHYTRGFLVGVGVKTIPRILICKRFRNIKTHLCSSACSIFVCRSSPWSYRWHSLSESLLADRRNLPDLQVEETRSPTTR